MLIMLQNSSMPGNDSSREDMRPVLAPRMRKLVYRVVFPFELKLRNTSEDCAHVDDAYQLFAVVVHVGSGPNHGAWSPHVPSLMHADVHCKLACWHVHCKGNKAQLITGTGRADVCLPKYPRCIWFA